MMQSPLSLGEFQEAIAAAKRQFLSIREKYPNLRAYLVLALRGSQIEIDSPLRKMIKEFPAVLAAGAVKNKMLKLLKEPQPEKPTDAEKKAWEDRFQTLAKELEFEGETQIEIRFGNLDYDLVWMLQADELVDRILTPQSRASIRIVLGTILSMQVKSVIQGEV